MFWKRKEKSANKDDLKCKVCGLQCFDEQELERHVNWAHKESKQPTK